MNERNEFITQMEASGLAPTWDTIYDLNVTKAIKRCGDCGTALQDSELLTHNCPQRRARLALVEMDAYTLWAVLWSIAMAVAYILAVYSAYRGGVVKAALFIIPSVIACALSRRASRQADEWAEKAKRELGVME